MDPLLGMSGVIKMAVAVYGQFDVHAGNHIEETGMSFNNRCGDRQRGYDPMQTIGHWHYVRRSEIKHIIPFIRAADYVLNGALPYELPFHKKYSFGYFPRFIEAWAGNPKRRDAFIRAERICRLLRQVEAYEDESVVPPDSLLREFIGGSNYKLH